MGAEIAVPVIDRVIELQPARLIDVEGFTHIDKDKTVTLFKPPVPETIHVNTLSGLVALLESGFENFETGDLVHVAAFDTVHFQSTASDKYGRRLTYITAKALKPERNFEFNKYMPQEDFNIALRSMFVQDEALNDLVQVAGSIAKETEIRQEDDGFGQRVTAKGGVHILREVTIKPRVTLRPFRTFTEVDQPTGDFVFRVRHDEGRGNMCALFEADAGAWKIAAMGTVRDWLKQQLKTSEVEAINSLPIVA